MLKEVSSSQILNIAFYKFIDLTDLGELRKSLKELLLRLSLKGTILISTEGVNGFLAGQVADIQKFKEIFTQDPRWSDVEFKDSYSEFVPHKRTLVKIKKEIIPLGKPEIRPRVETAPRISAQELKTWLDEGRDFDLLDTRNTYEIEHGTFEKAFHLDLDHFRNFPGKLREHVQSAPKKPLVMFCTGGIRCEKAGVVALQEGYDEVFQLEGGILKYFEEVGGAHYKGDCFVFDHRVALDPELQPHPDKPTNRSKLEA